MAWSHLQGAGANTNSVASLAKAFTTANLSAGSKMLAFVSIGSTSSVSTSGVSDGTNAFTKLATFTYTTFSGTVPNESTIWELDTPAGDVGTKPTITATFTGGTAASGSGMVIQEVSGLQTGSSCLDGAAGTSSTTGTLTTDAFPTYSSSASSEYLVQFYNDSGNGASVSTPTGYAGQDNNGINGNLQVVVAWKNSTGGSETGSWTGLPGSNAGYGLMAVAFLLPGSNLPPVDTKPLMVNQAVKRTGYF